MNVLRSKIERYAHLVVFGAVLIFATFITSTAVRAEDTIGVGVGTGKITLNDKLRPGTRYELPPLTVVNTGTVPSEYEVTVSYHEQQPEARPKLEWFSFQPTQFSLKPGEAKDIAVVLTLPVQTEPGEYFAYLEAHPAKKATDSSGTSIGIAAAAKLYFTVEPANVFQGLYYRALSLYDTHLTKLKIIAAILGIFVLLQLLRRFFSFDIKLRPTSHHDEK